MSFKSFFSSVILFFIFSVASAGTVNIDQIMRDSAERALYPKYYQCLDTWAKGDKGRTFWCWRSWHRNDPPSITNVVVTSGAFQYSNLNVSNYPYSVNISALSIPNCTSVPIDFTQLREISVQESATITKSTTVATEKSITLNGSGEINLGIVKLNGGTSVSGKEVVTNASGTTNVITSSLKETITLQTKIPAYTAKIIDVIATKNSATIDYFGDVFLDGLVNNKYSYSSLVPNNKVTINGVIASNYLISTTIQYRDVPLNPATCQMTSAANVSFASGDSSKAQTKVEAQNFVVDLNLSYTPNGIGVFPKQVSEKVDSGVQILTANVIGSIQVRARQSSNSVCGATFQSDSRASNLQLVAGQWSDWVTVDTHVGAVVRYISVQNDCGGQIESEVRYFR
jgi:hypothetical protein